MAKTLRDIDFKFISWFVTGACIQYLDVTGALSYSEKDKRGAFIQRVREKVFIYLADPKRGPGADCSDFECTLILDARKVFDLREPKPVEGGVCEFCGGPNLDHMSGPCAEQRRRGFGSY